jgi:prepilin-type N-terminal cleavage/methylation domain-containing protein
MRCPERLLDRAGLTLPELLVAIAITGLIMAGLLGLLIAGQQSVGEGSNMVDAQQSARIAIHRMMQDIRGAGYNPSGDPALFTAITAQSAMSFTIQNDWNGNGIIETNVTTAVSGVNRGEQVTYFVVGNTLRRRESNIHPSPWNLCDGATDLTCVIAPVEQATFEYRDATDAVTAVAANIRTIVAALQVRPQTQPAATLQGKVLVSMTDRARIRNR